jgi:hypothetical protein
MADIFARPPFYFSSGGNELTWNKKKPEVKKRAVGFVDENIWDPMLDEEEDDW